MIKFKKFLKVYQRKLAIFDKIQAIIKSLKIILRKLFKTIQRINRVNLQN